MTATQSQTEAILEAVLDVLEDHDILVGSSITSFKELRQDLSDAITKVTATSSDDIGTLITKSADALQATIAGPIPLSEDTKKALKEIDLAIARALTDGSRCLLQQAATFTHDGEMGDAYYFAPVERAAPPYLKQVHADAILDIGADGSLAGVELLLEGIPPHSKQPARGG